MPVADFVALVAIASGVCCLMALAWTFGWKKGFEEANDIWRTAYSNAMEEEEGEEDSE